MVRKKHQLVAGLPNRTVINEFFFAILAQIMVNKIVCRGSIKPCDCVKNPLVIDKKSSDMKMSNR